MKKRGWYSSRRTKLPVSLFIILMVIVVVVVAFETKGEVLFSKQPYQLIVFFTLSRSIIVQWDGKNQLFLLYLFIFVNQK